jgi:sulfatase modifying factor 1
MLMNLSSLVFTPSRSAGGFFAVLQFAIVVSLALIAASFYATPARAELVTIDWVTVGDPGNAPNVYGNGAVSYDYRISKYHVTISQYAEFLNAVAGVSDPYGLYNSSMAGDGYVRGIQRQAVAGGWSYVVMDNNGWSGNRPINYVTWFNAARFANWMTNGQGNGSTETGAYSLNGATSGTVPVADRSAAYRIPSRDEWFKAAVYDADRYPWGGEYYRYGTSSDTLPGNVVGSTPNQANFYNGVYSVTQSANQEFSRNYLTDVGAFTNSASPYGAFDMGSNTKEWYDLPGSATDNQGYTQGAWNENNYFMSSDGALMAFAPATTVYQIGFRLAAPVAVPEPSTYVMALAGLGCGGYLMRRRRKRA